MIKYFKTPHPSNAPKYQLNLIQTIRITILPKLSNTKEKVAVPKVVTTMNNLDMTNIKIWLTLNKAVLDLRSKILQSTSLQEAKRPKRILLVLHSKTRSIWRTNSILSAWSVLLENQIAREFLVQWQ